MYSKNKGACLSTGKVKIGSLAIGLAALLIMWVFAIASPCAYAASSKNITLFNTDWGKNAATIKKYDVTGDGKKDTIKIATNASPDDEYGMFTKMRIAVNGKSQSIRATPDSAYTGRICLLTLSNGMRYIYTNLSDDESGGDNNNRYCLYDCGKGKFRLAIDFAKLGKASCTNREMRWIKAKGNIVVARIHTDNCDLKALDITCTCKYSKGALKPSFTTSVFSYAGKKTKAWVKASRNIKVYKSPKAKKTKLIAKKNTKFKLVKIKFIGKKVYFKARLANGKTGWIKSTTNPYKHTGKSLIAGMYWYPDYY